MKDVLLNQCMKDCPWPRTRPDTKAGLQVLPSFKFLRMIMAALCLLVLSPGTGRASEMATHGITLNEKKSSLEKVFLKIRKQTGFDFLYNTRLLKNTNPVTISVTNSPLEDVLNAVFKDQPLTYSILENTILIKAKEPASALVPVQEIQNKESLKADGNVRGRVVDSKGEALPGVTVKVKGTVIGVVTDQGGRYSIRVPDQGTLVFTSVGYISHEEVVNGRELIDVRMQDQSKSVNEVVVTALGISRQKKALAYSLTEVKGEEFTQARENNLGNALSGKVAGLNASSSATGPGGSSRVIIRGNGSLGGENQPLYVVNGVPINNTTPSSAGTYGGIDRGDGLNSINPDDIESISVLKGGTAAALYGSRAANGVILITTKSGKAQKGIGVELNSDFTFETALDIPDWQYEYGSGSRGLKPTSQSEAVANGRISWGAKLDGSSVVQPDGVSRPYSAQKNNVKNFYREGNTFSNTLALNGGNEAANFRFSISNMDNHGIVPNSGLNRKTFNLSANGNLSNKVIFDGKAQFNIETNRNRTYLSDFTKNPNASVGLIATNIDVRTLAPGYDAQGFETPWSDYVFVVNPYFAVNKVRNEDDRKRFIGSFGVRYNITKELYARARMGIDYFTLNANDIDPTGLLYNPTGSMTADKSLTYETNVEGIIGYDKKAGLFSINAFVGGNQMHNVFSGTHYESGLFNVPFAYFLSNGKSPTFLDTYKEYAINSLFASADIGFRNYLYLSLTAREDWFSTLSIKSNHLLYPSAGLSWVFSDSWGSSKPGWLSYGKLRGSYAQVGGGAPNPYGLDLAYIAQTSSHLGQPLMNISGTNIPNPSLKPYTSTTTEFGLESRMLNNRIGFDLTLYNRVTTNDIVNASVPTSTSYSTVSLNVGKMQNRGIEFLLNGSPFRSRGGFNWDISLNLAYNMNKVIKIADGLTSLALPGAEARTNNGFIYHYEGLPFGQIAGYSVQKDAQGRTVYNAANGIPVQSDFRPLGRGVPPLTGGLSNTFEYRNFSLGVLLDGKFGAKMYTSTTAYGTYYGLDKRTAAGGVREKGVTVNGVDTQGNPFTQTLAAQDYFQGIAFSITDNFVQKAGFIKLRQLTFGYSIPQSLLSKTPFSYARLSFVARNLLIVYSQVKNVDPESNYNNSNGQGLENFGVPPTRSYGLNLMVRF